MATEPPETGLTLGKVKQWLSANTLAYTMQKSSKGLILGEYEWTVNCKEEVDDNYSQKRNYRLYTKGLEDDSKARWEKNQGPTLFPPPIPEPTFLDGARDFIRAEVVADRIRAGELIYGDNDMERATATVIDATNTEKYVVIKREADVFSMEDYTPIKIVSKASV